MVAAGTPSFEGGSPRRVIAPSRLTAKQKEVMRLRYEHSATFGQIAAWLKISRRAVLYRIHNARRRLGELPRNNAISRQRMYSASQISVAAKHSTLNLDQV